MVFLGASIGTPADRESVAAALPAESPPPGEGEITAIEEPKQPVQPVEKRGDAILFECEALCGTPFDQAVVMPLD